MKTFKKITHVLLGFVLIGSMLMIMAISVMAMKGAGVDLDGSFRMWLILLTTSFAGVSLFAHAMELFGLRKW